LRGILNQPTIWTFLTLATLRAYKPDDSEALAKVYREAARVLGRPAYSEKATRVWALYPEDMEGFRATLAEGLTLCAVSDGFPPIAFGQLNPDDHIVFLYCHPAHARRGHGSAILGESEAHARSRKVATIRVEASGDAQPLFERFGYQIIKEEKSTRHDLQFVRYKMSKQL
jgi:putative acetyltransferase